MASEEGAAGRDRGSRRRGVPPASDGGAGRAGDPVVRILLALTGAFAVVAAVVVVVSEDGRMLRLGVIAGLWATLLAVAALARRSGAARSGDAAAREESLRRTYELELAAEVDARREHELTVERTVRREVAAESGEEIAGLRAELERLRSHLEQTETHAVRPALQVVAGGRPSGPPISPSGPPTPPAGPPPGPPRRAPGPPPPSSRPATDGRTVAELLAAHSEEGRRRRR
ncbi:hypothetical protein LQ327_11685 [Actinomycetospora endophytica]|uniref:DUF6779 domain-containing protein n=1 Tax=Actinomycetospora endophytica TaxID=2291215 RepID=A0ABS8P9H0_9PSEU|nr:DUF6779 domain-containing protein [Actinomycetospora endophytica]MCD2194036.1 hypothetical protein [Actinomycetospora endophytica]